MIMVAVSMHSEITAGENGKLSEIRTCHRINEDGKLNDTHREQKTELITVKLSALLAAGFTIMKAVYKIIHVVCVEMRQLQILESYTRLGFIQKKNVFMTEKELFIQ